MEVEVHPVSEIKPIALMERGPVKRIRGLSASSNLPTHISERQKEEAVKRIRTELNLEAEIEIESSAPAIGAGSFVFLTAETDQGRGGFSSLGKRGKRAEEVAADAVDELRDYLLSDACLDPHLSDQVVLFMGLAKGVSSFTTSRITEHLLTNLWVMRQFLDVRFTLTGELGRRGKVEISRE